MSIDSITIRRLSVPMHQSYGSAHHRDFDEMESTLVEITGEGEYGIGTADATPGYSIQTHDEIVASLRDRLGPAVLEADPRTPNALLEVFAAVDQIPNAKCALEVAFLDWYGTVHDQPLSELLWGARRDRVPLNGWVGIDTPETMAEEAREWLADGYRSIKIKLSGDADTDVERVAAVCDAVCEEGMDVRADVNQGYDVETAIEVAKRLEDYPLTHLEQPVPKGDVDGLARVTDSTSTVIMADEAIQTAADAFDILARGAADRIKVKILRMGGVLGTRRVLEAAALADTTVVVGHGFGLSPATAAEVTMTATHDAVFGAVESVGPLKMAAEPFAGLTIENGYAELPTGSGHGVDVDRSALEEVTDETHTVS
ncbi:L-alanine-DL-glutamate epimerase or related enzyme of enolase superfamily [Halanaeroarchaeum sp. HSR-CO]|uniref:mandelate racemase/muconate lactonizing enzyme family protein n=1 Tax=Halanaeroarchaeum sp. HSR-CO TaxID=2866382 RepID=UPI00217F1D10|nr:enolase C-terminal domain-like protein [Halanaeroarchaeum sp. HSR-CO]UWG46329.1 L-alanine-DL-glutamate epimerase or related enzyme of enolase superfamily [Halanaeroarchaeum sp. HSR-CO]